MKLIILSNNQGRIAYKTSNIGLTLDEILGCAVKTLKHIKGPNLLLAPG